METEEQRWTEEANEEIEKKVSLIKNKLYILLTGR